MIDDSLSPPIPSSIMLWIQQKQVICFARNGVQPRARETLFTYYVETGFGDRNREGHDATQLYCFFQHGLSLIFGELWMPT